MDVVPASESQFSPKIREGRIFGRGACDAKGVATSMIAAAIELKKKGTVGFCLLFVVGEETDGIGARLATTQLSNRGIKYIVNGEPTEGKLIEAHKGGITFEVSLVGKSCHSGYPERGIDANVALINLAKELIDSDFGNDQVLGRATINLGVVSGGTASNIVSDRAQIQGMIRTVGDNADVVAKLNNIIGDRAKLTIVADAPKVTLKSLPGFDGGIVNYCTDIPHLLPLGAEMLLYGPGSINDAHTDNESVSIEELYAAKNDYIRIVDCLLAI